MGVRRTELFEARFWSKVDVKGPDECWDWKAALQHGYGTIRRNGRSFGAHRIAFALFHRRNPEKFVLHKCDNRACVNPLHLYEGDYIANAKDLYMKGGGQRKLSDEDVRETRRLYKTGQYSQGKLAARFGCGRSNINKILNGQIYVRIR